MHEEHAEHHRNLRESGYTRLMAFYPKGKVATSWIPNKHVLAQVKDMEEHGAERVINITNMHLEGVVACVTTHAKQAKKKKGDDYKWLTTLTAWSPIG